uniref:ANK_REP_REGION domain-containing protein n=1 Tax=Parastrongyloides trichosuri TaxID=131310 RepID=A0A0N4ZH08_PARTI
MPDTNLTNNKNAKKKLTFNDPEISNWSECEASLCNLIENIKDDKLKSSIANKICLMKLICEMEYIDEMKSTINKFFMEEEFEMMDISLCSEESNNSQPNMEELEENINPELEDILQFSLPDIMESLRSRFKNEENEEATVNLNVPSFNSHMFNEFSMNSIEPFSETDMKNRICSPEDFSLVNKKLKKKVKFADEEKFDDIVYETKNCFESYESNVKANSFKQKNTLFATQQFFEQDEEQFDEDMYNNDTGDDEYREKNVDFTLFQTQATFTSDLKESTTDNTNINFFDTQMPIAIDNTKFLTASQFPVFPDKSNFSFKIPGLPCLKNFKKPSVSKQMYGNVYTTTVFEAALEKRDSKVKKIIEEIKKAEIDDCNFFGTDSSPKRETIDDVKYNNVEDIDLPIENENQERENSGLLKCFKSLEVKNDESSIKITKVKRPSHEKIMTIKYLVSDIDMSKDRFPESDRSYIKENEKNFPITFHESQYIDRIPTQTLRLSMTFSEIDTTNSNIECQKKNFDDFCDLLKKTRSKIQIIQTFKEKNNFDLNKFDKVGMTPLHYAVLTNKVKIVKWLIENCNHYINPHGGYDAKTPLHLAILFKRKSIVTELLSKIGIDIHAKDIYGITPYDICPDDDKIKKLFSNLKRKSFIKNNYFKCIPRIWVDHEIDIDIIKKWKKIPLRTECEVMGLSEVTTHWITKSLSMDMVKESDTLYEAIIRRVYILHERSLNLLFDHNSIDKFNTEENKYTYFNGVLLDSGKYESSHLKEGPKTKLAMKPNLFRGCFFYIDKYGVDMALGRRISKWILLGEGELIKSADEIEIILNKRKDIIPFYGQISSSLSNNTFIITDKNPEMWMEDYTKKNVLIKTTDFVKRCIRCFTIDYSYD